MLTLNRFSIGAVVCLTASVVLSAAVPGQRAGEPTFSIDVQSPTVGLTEAWSPSSITAGDILSSPIPAWPIGTPGPGPFNTPPGISVPYTSLGLVQVLTAGPPEVDALSYGNDALRVDLNPHVSMHFSVDRLAVGVPGLLAPPNVFTEGASGSQEAAADVFINATLPVPSLNPLPPPLPPYPTTLVPGAGNTSQYDGNGVAPSGLPGYALAETVVGTPHHSDDLDAVDVDTVSTDLNGPIFFSLDTASTQAYQVAGGVHPVGGDVLKTTAAGPPVVYVSAASLGLDQAGPNTDDLDALALWDDDGVWEPSTEHNTRANPILFSVRRGSAVIGQRDSIFGAPIEEGDVLTDPAMAATILNRAGKPPSPFAGSPGIIIAAEQLGLVTARFNSEPADDLNALDAVAVPEPTTMAVVALGGTLFLVRRRRKA